jgi:hypothetical protein
MRLPWGYSLSFGFTPKLYFCFWTTKDITIDKDSDKKLVGQPILRQILDLVPKRFIDRLVIEHDLDRY